MGCGKTNGSSESLQEQVKIPVRIFDGDMQRNYIFEKIQKELERRQADVRMLVNAAGYARSAESQA